MSDAHPAPGPGFFTLETRDITAQFTAAAVPIIQGIIVAQYCVLIIQGIIAQYCVLIIQGIIAQYCVLIIQGIIAQYCVLIIQGIIAQ